MPFPLSSSPSSRPVSGVLLLLVLVLAQSACVKRSRDTGLSNAPSTQLPTSSQAINQPANDQQSGNSPHIITSSNQPGARRTNINTAPTAELEKLPGIGKGLAERIVDHRERFGPFRRTEHLIVVRGISDRRFRELRDWITVE
jgi:competence ComEA-like helix-hairpin-helix protein